MVTKSTENSLVVKGEGKASDDRMLLPEGGCIPLVVLWDSPGSLLD